VTIGILGAIPEEIAHLRDAIPNPHRTTRGMREYFQGELAGQDVVLAFSRWGKVAAASTATTLIEAFCVKSVLFVGVAGAVAPELAVGDIVVATELIQHDMDVSAILQLKRFEVPLLQRSTFPVAPRLVELATRAAERYLAQGFPRDVPRETLRRFGIAAPKVRAGLVASGDRFIADAAEVARLRALLPAALCVEMEGAAVAQVCYEHGVPAMVMRTVSDKADHAAPVDFDAFIDRIASHVSRGVVGEILARL
jgi:adenosylhomocysteine nucleosidase